MDSLRGRFVIERLLSRCHVSNFISLICLNFNHDTLHFYIFTTPIVILSFNLHAILVWIEFTAEVLSIKVLGFRIWTPITYITSERLCKTKIVFIKKFWFLLIFGDKMKVRCSLVLSIESRLLIFSVILSLSISLSYVFRFCNVWPRWIIPWTWTYWHLKPGLEIVYSIFFLHYFKYCDQIGQQAKSKHVKNSWKQEQIFSVTAI